MLAVCMSFADWAKPPNHNNLTAIRRWWELLQRTMSIKPGVPNRQTPLRLELAAASFIEAGLRFIESIATASTAGPSEGESARRLDRNLLSLFTRDDRTNRPALTIPLPESVTQERFTSAVSALVNTLGQAGAIILESAETANCHAIDAAAGRFDGVIPVWATGRSFEDFERRRRGALPPLGDLLFDEHGEFPS